MSRSSWTLFETHFRVRPPPEHPLFFDFDFGILKVFLFAECGDSAAARATAIVRCLPYEIQSPRVRWRAVPDEVDPRLKPAVADARQLGLGLFLLGAPVGSDEIEGFDGP